MQLWKNTAGKVSSKVWFWAGICSLILLGIVLYQINWVDFQQIIRNISYPMLAIAMLVLLLEGFFTAKRMHLFTPEAPSYKACLQVIAWFVVLLVILPARLGEIAIIFLMGYFLNQNSGSAVISALCQRLFDLLVLSVFFVFILLLQSNALHSEWYLIAGIACLILLLAVLLLIKPVLAWFKGKFKLPSSIGTDTEKVTPTSLKQKLVSLIHDADDWYQANMSRQKLFTAFGLTVGKWLCNLGGIALLFTALQVPLSFWQNSFLAASYNFLAVVPIQTIGGFGVSEAGLAGLLVLFDQELSYAASISMVTRIFLILNPILFWLLVMALFSYKRPVDSNETSKK